MVSLIFCFIILITYLVNAQQNVTVENDVVDLLKEMTPQCYEEPDRGFEILKRILQWQYGDDEISKKFFYCLFNNAGFLDKTGHINNEKFSSLFDKIGKKELAYNSVIECNKINDIDPVETSHKLILCFSEKSSLKLIANLDK